MTRPQSQAGSTGGSDLALIYGADPAPLVPALLDHLGAAAELPRRGVIGIKPNLILPRPAASGATTDPQLVEALIGWLRGHTAAEPVILESAWVGARTGEAFAACGYRELADRCGVELVDLKSDATRWVGVDGTSVEVCRRPLEVDYLIDVPVLKAHCQTGLTCALKNLKGCIPDREKRRCHRIGLHPAIARLARALPVDLVLVDGLCGDLTFEEGGHPVRQDRLLAGRDPVLIDAYAATLLGLRPAAVGYIGRAAALGVGSADLAAARITALNKPTPAARSARAGAQAATPPFAERIAADQACSPCLGGLVHALQRLADRDRIEALSARIAVGQGHQQRRGPGPGIGDCTRGLHPHCPGCPPSAQQMVAFLEDWIVRPQSAPRG